MTSFSSSYQAFLLRHDGLAASFDIRTAIQMYDHIATTHGEWRLNMTFFDICRAPWPSCATLAKVLIAMFKRAGIDGPRETDT